jgi:hypothetical protein
VTFGAPAAEDNNLELAISRWLRSYRTYRSQFDQESEESLFELEANLLFHFSAHTALSDDLLFPMFTLFILMLKATHGAAGHRNSIVSYTASER